MEIEKETTEELVKEYHKIISELQQRHSAYNFNLSIDDYEADREEDFEIWLSMQ